MTTLNDIANIIKKCKSAVIFTHGRPDGDTIGCALALSRALSLLGIQSEVVNEATLPERYCFLEGAKQVKLAPTLDADCYICVDTSDENRLGALRDTYLAGARGKVTVNIDHHVSNKRYAKYNFVQNRASNCENIAGLIKELGVPYTPQIAEALMTGMVTDSGGFSHSDVNGESFRMAGEMADAGADVSKIHYETIKKQSRPRAQFFLKVLSKLRFLLDDQLAVALITQELINEFNLTSDATEGIVDFALTIDTVEVSACIFEVKKGQYKVSLRSKGKVDVNEVAGVFGGGGHILASGCMLFGEAEEVVEKIRYAVWQRI